MGSFKPPNLRNFRGRCPLDPAGALLLDPTGAIKRSTRFALIGHNMASPPLFLEAGSTTGLQHTPRTVFQELPLVTASHTMQRFIQKRVICPLFLQGQSTLLFVLCTLHIARQRDWTLTCMFYDLFNYNTLPSVFNEEMPNFLIFSHF